MPKLAKCQNQRQYEASESWTLPQSTMHQSPAQHGYAELDISMCNVTEPAAAQLLYRHVL